MKLFLRLIVESTGDEEGISGRGLRYLQGMEAVQIGDAGDVELKEEWEAGKGVVVCVADEGAWYIVDDESFIEDLEEEEVDIDDRSLLSSLIPLELLSSDPVINAARRRIDFFFVKDLRSVLPPPKTLANPVKISILLCLGVVDSRRCCLLYLREEDLVGPGMRCDWRCVSISMGWLVDRGLAEATEGGGAVGGGGNVKSRGRLALGIRRSGSSSVKVSKAGIRFIKESVE